MLVLTGIKFLSVNCDFAWEIIFESVILTSAVVVSLTVYTFWAKKHAPNFWCMEAQFFLAGVITLVVILLIQVSTIYIHHNIVYFSIKVCNINGTSTSVSSQYITR